MVAPVFHPVPPSARSAEHTARSALSRREALHDATLVSRFNAGEEAAFVEIVHRYRAKMLLVALNLLRNRADAEEIAQDTFIRAHRGLARFRGDSSLAAWLYRITLNLARNRYWYFFRRRRHKALPLDAALSEGDTATFAELVASDMPGPVHEATTREFAAIITDCMSRLPPGQRAILTLRNVQQHSYRQISRSMGIQVGTAKSRIARARNSLRLLLTKSYPEMQMQASPLVCFEPLRGSGRLAACA